MKFFIREHHVKATVGSVLSRGGGSLLLQRKRRKVTPVNSSLEDFPSKPREGISAQVQGRQRGSISFKDVPSTKLLIGSSRTNRERATPPPMNWVKHTEPEAWREAAVSFQWAKPSEFGEKWNYSALEFFLVNVFFLSALAKCALQLCVCGRVSVVWCPGIWKWRPSLHHQY